MCLTKRALITLVFGLLLLFIIPLHGTAHDHYVLEGLVIDNDKNPIANVWVRLYRGEQEIGDDITSAKGRYALEFEPGTAITTVRFDHLQREHHGRFHPVVVTNLSGDTDHRLTKVMSSKVARSTTVWEDLELLAAYERGHFLDKAQALEGIRQDVYKRYIRDIGMWKTSPTLLERWKNLRTLYLNNQ